MSEIQFHSAALLTIGTEVTSGQIVNTNASWLSDQLANIQIEVQVHLSVQDELWQIIDALNFLVKNHQVILVTGGLGPTRDDLTRNAVAEWTKQALEFHPESWERIVARLESYGIQVAESNRQQCFFPIGSTIYKNEIGTANAFQIRHLGCTIVCLPGPPREIQRIWSDHLHESLKKLVPESHGSKLYRWQCLGKSESSLGELVEEVIKGSPLVSGYRPHMPYVEVKIWVQIKDLVRYQSLIQRLEETLQPWIIGKDDDDLAVTFIDQVSIFDEITIYDLGSFGVISERLGTPLRSLKSPTNISIQTQINHDRDCDLYAFLSHKFAEGQPNATFAVGPLLQDGSWQAGIRLHDKIIVEFLHLPYKSKDLAINERNKRFLAEKTLHWWHIQNLNSEAE